MGKIHVFERVKNCGISLHLSPKLFLSSSFRLHHQFQKFKCGEWAGGERLSFNATRLDCFKGEKERRCKRGFLLVPLKWWRQKHSRLAWSARSRRVASVWASFCLKMLMCGWITSACQVSALQRSGSSLPVQPNSPGVKGIPLATVSQKRGLAGRQTDSNTALCSLLCRFQGKEGKGGRIYA